MECLRKNSGPPKTIEDKVADVERVHAVLADSLSRHANHIKANFNLIPVFVHGCIAIREVRNKNFRLYNAFESSSAEQRLQWQDLQDHLDTIAKTARDYEFSLKNSGVRLQAYVTALKSNGEYPIPNEDEVRSAFQEIHSRLESIYVDQAANVFDWREIKPY